MQAHFIYNEFDDRALLIPSVCIGRATCENPNCNLTHGFVLTLTFLLWEAGVGFTWDRQ
jgi:hypothetical protein